MPVLDERQTSAEIAAARPKLAIVPLAAIEQHGPHLPVATDLIIMEAVARQVAAALPEQLWLLPVFPYGTSMSQAGFAGTFWLTADTLMSVVRDVVESLYAHGFERVVVMNNHGAAGGTTSMPRGNFIVKTAVRQLNYDHPDRAALWVQPFAAAGMELREIFGPVSADDLHAGAVETSLLLHLRPDLVGERGAGQVPAAGPELLDVITFDRLCPGGVWGNPRAGNAALGARALQSVVAGTVEYITTRFDQLAWAKGAAAGSHMIQT